MTAFHPCPISNGMGDGLYATTSGAGSLAEVAHDLPAKEEVDILREGRKELGCLLSGQRKFGERDA